MVATASASDGSGDDEDLTMLVVGALHLVALATIGWLLRRCCCRKAEPDETGDKEPPTAEPAQMQKKKRLSTGYLLWLFTGPLGNAHLFYLGRIVHGVLANWTVNFAGLGWLCDAFMLPSYVRAFNARHASPQADKDTSLRSLGCRLPMMLLTLAGVGLLMFCYFPWALHTSGIVDIDRLAAQTERNPYDVLDLPRNAGLQEAKSAYRKLSLKWHPDRNVGCKECEAKMSEISKAYELIKRRRAPPPEEFSFESWYQGILNDWKHVLEVFNAPDEGPSDGGGASNAKARSDL